MRLQYQGYDLESKFKFFDMIEGVYDFETISPSNQKFIWSHQRFNAAIENLTKINFRVYSSIPNILYLNNMRFEIMPNVVINICLENMKFSNRIFGNLERLHSHPSDTRYLGIMIYSISVDGTDLF
jgi:hypothetical protein